MDVVLVPLFKIILEILSLYRWALIIYVILSWLFFFGVVNADNQFIRVIGGFLSSIIEPVLTPIRRFIPVVGGFDLSMLALFFGIYFVEMVLGQILFKIVV